MSDAPKDSTRLSAHAESLFFRHAEWTAADWRQRLAAGEIDGERLSPEVIEELARLVDGLAHFTEMPADLQPSAAAIEETPAAQPLEVVGRGGGSYQLLDRLGTGGHGIVYRGRQRTPFERVVAVKVYYADGSGVESLEGIRELEAVRRLHHPGICDVLDAGVTPWLQPFLIFQYVDGVPLHRSLQERHPSFEARLQLFDDVLDAMAYSHAEGVVHRDLKPQNILIHTASGRPQVIDFGISRITEPSCSDPTTLTANSSGTREYQSPEQAGWIDHAVDARTDVYALGCVLFELLTGEQAFPREDVPRSMGAAELCRRHAHKVEALKGRLEPVLARRFPHLSSEQRTSLGEIIRGCVRTIPDARIPTVEELRGHLASLVTGQAVTVADRGRRRSWWSSPWIIAAAVLAAVVVGGAGWWMSRSWQEPPQPQPAPSAGVPDPPEPRSSPEGTLAVLRWFEAVAARSPRMRTATAEAVSKRIFTAAVETATAPVAPGDAAAEARRREAWLADVLAELAFLDPAMAREVGGLLVDQALAEGMFDMCGTLVTALDQRLGDSPNDLRVRSEQMAVGLTEQVIRGREEEMRAAAGRLLGLLQQKGMLTTTEEGQRLAAAYADLP